MRRAFKKYDRFPKFSTFDALANSAGIQLPLIIIAAMAVGPEAGFLLLAMRTMQAPMGLIGAAVSQVYISHARDELRKGNLGDFTAGILGGLARTGVGPLILLGGMAPPVFAFVFGEEWRRAGELVVWMTPWFAFQFLSSPISMVMHVRNWQKAMLLLTVFGLFLRLGALGFAAFQDPDHLSEYFAISSGLFYFACCCVFALAGYVRPREIARVAKEASAPIMCWAAFAVICRLLLRYLEQ
jgi:O-antigen/teichoic acid export membrane protein